MPETDAKQNAVSFLLEQHDQIRRLFDDVERSAGAAREEAFRSLVRLLAVHETAEEEVVYPALRTTGEAASRMATKHLREEDQAKMDLVDLERMGTSSPDFEVAFKSFRSAVEAHAEGEESDVFPLLLKGFDEPRLQQMANVLRDLRETR